MSDKTGTTTNSRILYFDPNNVKIKGDIGENLNAIFEGLEIMKDPEDYSIAVDLEVVNKNRSIVKVGNIKGKDGTAQNTQGTTISNFLSGTKIGGENVLTTYFDNITYDKYDPRGAGEAMSIESIDIEFTSWYVASVIIKFVDVRGASLFSPTESVSSLSDGNQTVEDENIFSSFFTMPYPIFNLKIKGFYGNAVTYPLHCSDFKAEFNNDKGNFDITANFIGYTYAMLSDIQMSYLMSAPYTELGKAYWDEQIKNGRFSSFESQPLSKIPELMRKIKAGERIISEIKGSNEIVKQHEILENENASIQNLKTLVDSYVNTITTETISSSNPTLKYGFKLDKPNVYKTTTSTVNLNADSGSSFSTLEDNLIKKISEHINTFTSSTTFNEFKDSNKNKQLENIKKAIGATSIIGATSPWSGTVDLNKVVKPIAEFQINFKSKNDDLVSKIASTYTNSINATYEMVPSIYNFIKLLLAHMETLLHIILQTAIKAEKDRGDSPAEIGKTDIRDNKLSPFFWLTVEDNGKDRDEWIGNVPQYENYPEVTLVKSFIKAQDDTQKEIKQIETELYKGSAIPSSDENISIGDIWLPLNAFDNSISDSNHVSQKSPYKSLLSDSGINNGELKALLCTRIATIVALSSRKYPESSTTEGDIIKDLTSFANAEVINITSSIDSSALINVKNMLNEIKGSVRSTTESNPKDLRNYNLLRKNGNYYEFNSLYNQTGTLPLTTNSTGRLSKDINSNTAFYYYKDPNTKNGRLTKEKSTNIKIIKGRKNCEIIYSNWYIPVKSKVANTNQEKILFNINLDKKYVTDSIVLPIYAEQPLLNRVVYKIKTEITPNNNNLVNELFANIGISSSLEYVSMPEQINLTTENPNPKQIKKIDFYDNKFKNNFYKLYCNKSITESIGDINNEIERENLTKVDSIENLTYPMIGGLSGDKPEYFSERDNTEEKGNNAIFLFGHPFYYAQNNIGKKGHNPNKAKAFLFLQTLPISITSTVKKLTTQRSSFMIRISRVEALLLGSMLWRKKSAESQYFSSIGIYYDIFNNSNDYIPKYTIPTVDSYIRVKNEFHLVEENDFTNFDTCNNLDLIPSGIANALMDDFNTWASKINNENKHYAWGIICENFELKSKNNETLNVQDFINLADKISKNYSHKTIVDEISSNVIKNYITIEPILGSRIERNQFGLINRDGSPGVNAVLNLLNEECIIQYTGDASLVLNSDKKTSMTVNNVDYVINTMLNSIKIADEANSTAKMTSEDITSQAIDNEGINIEVYKYLKTLYDKWVSGYKYDDPDSEYKWIDSNKKRINSLQTYDIRKFKFIDRSYNNIGDKFIIDIQKTLENFLGENGKRTLYSTITDILSDNQFLFLPLPNYQKWNTKEDFEQIFQPIPYKESNISSGQTQIPVFICMYTGTPSKSLNINTSNYAYINDSLNLNVDDKTLSVPSDYISKSSNNIDDDADILDTIPAFAVSYGKQNQSYFKKISLNMNNPTTTDASIAALRGLLEKSDKPSSGMVVSQNLYNIYSTYSYTCDIEMLGCPQIQPMMYFQLTNIPMWNGAYLIYKVKHSIRAGNMTTNITGMRMSNAYPKLLQSTVIGYNTLNNSSFNVSPISAEKSNVDLDKLMGTSGHFKLREYVTKPYSKDIPSKKITKGMYSYGVEVQDEIFSYIVDRIDKNLAPTIDAIYDSWMVSDAGKKYGAFRINSGYRLPASNGKSQHNEGLAADIQLIKGGKEPNEALFQHIKGMMGNGLKMDQLINEVSSGKEGTGGWCHVSPIHVQGNEVKIRGEVFRGTLYDETTVTTPGSLEIIENAKSNGKILPNSEMLQRFINYWTNAEAEKTKEGHWYDDLWHSYLDKGNVQTIAYGLQLPSSSSSFKTAIGFTQNDPTNSKILTCTDEQALSELRFRINKALPEIERLVDGDGKSSKGRGAGKFNRISNKYRYCLVDVYLRGGWNEWGKFIDYVCENDITNMANYWENRANDPKEKDQRRAKLFYTYIKGL